jgi:hypothetical protein
VYVAIRASADVTTSIVEAPYHPVYGREVTTRRIEWSHEGDLPLEVRVEARRL